MSLATSLLALAASTATLAPADSASLDRTVAGIYRPYAVEAAQMPVWERPLFSQETKALIDRWQTVIPEDELDGLNDGDWLCLCQDWNPKQFRTVTLGRQALDSSTAELRMRIDLGIGQQREARLIFKKEARGWRIDDMFAADFPRGLKQALRETIAEDEKLPK